MRVSTASHKPLFVFCEKIDIITLCCSLALFMKEIFMGWFLQYERRSTIMAQVGFAKKEVDIEIDDVNKANQAEKEARKILAMLKEKPYEKIRNAVLCWRKTIE